MEFFRLLYDDGVEGDSGGGASLAGSGEGGSWVDSLPEEIRGHSKIQEFKGKPIDDFAKSYINAQSKILQKGVLVPPPNAEQAELDAFYNSLGRPESHDKYSMPENMPEGFKVDDARLDYFRQKAHAAGLTDDQFAKLLRADAERQAEIAKSTSEEYSRQMESVREELKKEWGSAYSEREQLALGVIDRFDKQGDVKELMNSVKLEDGSLLGNHPAILKMMAEIGKTFGEHAIHGGRKSSDFAMTPADAKAELDSMKIDPEKRKILNTHNHPGRQALLDRQSYLIKISSQNS